MRIGCGAGYAGDRLEAAVDLVSRGELDYLVLECLAERTMALATALRRSDPTLGYDSALAARMEALLPLCARRPGRPTRLISNLGAANPLAAAERTAEIAGRLGLTDLLVGAVDGDNVLDRLAEVDAQLLETSEPVRDILPAVRWAHAYVGAEALVPALRAGCDVVIGGRIADPSLFVAPLAYEFGWALDDWALLGSGTLVGHLLECGSSVTGGYFADPGRKDVTGMSDVGMPIADVAPDGTATITKTPGSGGSVSVRTCREQLLYEIHDPAGYLTPDVTADFSRAGLADAGPDRVALSGGSGRSRPDLLKVIMGVDDGFIGEGEMSYAGPNAIGRARLAAEIVQDRLRRQRIRFSSLRTDYIGHDSTLGPIARRLAPPDPFEVRLRIAARTSTLAEAHRIGEEVEALTITGPAGGCGKRSAARAVVSVRSTLVPRSLVTNRLTTFRS